MLNPSNEYVEKVCQSLVREYVIRRGYGKTLRMFNRETASLIPTLGFYGSRLELGKDLGMEGLMKLNKESSRPLKSMLEVLVKCFLQDRKLLLQSSFVNSCYYTSSHHPQRPSSIPRRRRRKRQEDGKEPQDEKESIIESHSPPLSHSTTHQESFVSHLAYHQDNKGRIPKETPHYSDANPVGMGSGDTIHPPETFWEKVADPHRKELGNAKAQILIYNEDPMATFCRKLQESKILRNHSKTSLSLDQSQDDGTGVGGDEYDGGGDSWIPEESKSYTSPVPTAATSTAAVTDRKPNSITNKISNDRMTTGDIKSHLTLGQNLLESKQNLLAKVSLSPEENEIRQQVKGDPDASGSSFPHSASSSSTSPNKSKSSKLSQKSLSQSQSSTFKSSTTVTTDQGFKFRDVDSLATPTESGRGNSGGQSSSRVGHAPAPQPEFFQKTFTVPQDKHEFFQKNFADDKRSVRSSQIKTLDMGTWQELKATVLGERGILQEGWIGQGFTFNHNIPFALVQKRGGPCGVLVAVQALLLRNLMFGSAYCDPNELPLEGIDFEASPRVPSGVNITMKRSLALIGTLTEILWRCGSQEQKGDEGTPHRTSVTVGLTPGGNSTFGPGSELRIFSDLDDLKTFVEANLYRFDCIGLLYSVVLTRGIASIQDDMDFSNSPLLGQHGYCTQEIMNLLTMGRAISNAFDNEYVLDDKRLKGISSQADIGLLSLFEHYNSYRVGSFLKNPRFPLWIVCSESHYSLLFSDDMELTGTTSSEGLQMMDESKRPPTFDLYYYDGLARQEKIIKLTISSQSARKPSLGNSVNQSNNNIIRGDVAIDDDLIPPLEKCIRTKWTGVVVDWNDTEPIL